MLKIQAGRLAGVRREERVCSSQRDLQTLAHVLFNCPITENIHVVQGLQADNLVEFFKHEDFTRTAAVLKAVAKQLNVDSQYSRYWPTRVEPRKTSEEQRLQKSSERKGSKKGEEHNN